MQNLQNNGLINEGLGNRCTPIPSMEDSREATTSSDCTPQQRLTTAFDEPNLYPESNRDSTAQQSRPCENVKTAGRQKWSKEENILLWKCYLLSKPKVRGYRKRFHNIWLDNGGKDIKEQNLCDQRSQILKKGWLTKVEMEIIERNLTSSNDDTQVAENVESIHVEYAETECLPNNPEILPSVNEDLEPLSEDENIILTRLNELLLSEDKPIFNLKKFNKRQVMSKTNQLNKILKHLQKPSTITDTRNLIQATSSLVGELLGAKKITFKPKKEPWWKRRIEEDIVTLRKDLSAIENWFAGTWKKRSEAKTVHLDKKYHLKKLGFKNAIESIKQRILAKANKIRRYNKRCKQFQDNKLFQADQTRFFRSLEEGNNITTTAPNPEEATEFWSSIWSNNVNHNESDWLGDIKEDLKNVEKQGAVSISRADLEKQLKRTASWKSPGPDGVHGFWFKHLSSLHTTICNQLNECLTNNSIPEWLTTGRTVLLMKDPAKGNEVGNYRPIACLNILWKILSGIFADKTYGHLEANNLLPFEQKGCRKDSRGTKDQLIIDKTVLKNCKRRLTNLCMAWIDFKKAYDMVPHSWILESLKMFGVADNLISFIQASMPNWSTNLYCNNSLLGNVKIKRGIFQGDSFSPILFVIALIPISLVLRKVKMGYKLKNNGPTINHLFFMDDLKLFARNENEIDSLVQTVQACCSDIGMQFGISKCSVLTMKRGKKVEAREITLPSGESMHDPDDSGYKYLGILELDSIMNNEMKEKVKESYFKRLKLLLRSALNSKNLFLAINSWAVAVVRYGASVLDWTKEEIDRMDRQTRKFLTIYGAFHPKSNVNRLYLKRKLGGRGLISIRDCVDGEVRNLHQYLSTSEEELLKFVSDSLNLDPLAIEDKGQFQKRLTEQRIIELKNMKLHGQFESQTRDIKSDESWDWLSKGDLKRETESLLMAAQEQALNTNSVKKNIYGTSTTDKCRMCGSAVESVTHIISQCSVLAQKEYKRRHDKVCQNIHWALCKKFGFDHAECWYNHVPVAILENENVKLLWDFSIQVDRKIDHYRPDIVIFHKNTRSCLIVDVAIPGDHKIDQKEIEKITNYADLKLEVSRMWNCEATVVPIIIGALGSIPKNLHKHLDKLETECKIVTFQKSALLGTANILRKVLAI